MCLCLCLCAFEFVCVYVSSSSSRRATAAAKSGGGAAVEKGDTRHVADKERSKIILRTRAFENYYYAFCGVWGVGVLMTSTVV